MGLIKPYVDQLMDDRDTLATNLAAKGVEVEEGETITSLADKVVEVPGPDNLETEMRMFDLQYMSTHVSRPYSEADYTRAEVDKVDELLTKLEGDDNNGE